MTLTRFWCRVRTFLSINETPAGTSLSGNVWPRSSVLLFGTQSRALCTQRFARRQQWIGLCGPSSFGSLPSGNLSSWTWRNHHWWKSIFWFDLVYGPLLYFLSIWGLADCRLLQEIQQRVLHTGCNSLGSLSPPSCSVKVNRAQTPKHWSVNAFVPVM